MLNQLKRLFWRKPKPTNVIFIGIDYLCFSLARALLDSNKQSEHTIEITAFIDDEPWNNRTQVHGSTVYSPSEISALVRKHDVKLIIQIQGESISIADNIWEGIFKTKAKLITLETGQDIKTMQTIVYQAL